LPTKISSKKNHRKKHSSKKAKLAALKPLTVKGKSCPKMDKALIPTLILEAIGNPQLSSKIKLLYPVPSLID
jgi:hypothetical protein